MAVKYTVVDSTFSVPRLLLVL